ncbi:MAG: caspase family protein, partial [Deltaproteobacteria bacterium]|nr:caspase family protein [Deltaproteobacteria bacterium]
LARYVAEELVKELQNFFLNGQKYVVHVRGLRSGAAGMKQLQAIKGAIQNSPGFVRQDELQVKLDGDERENQVALRVLSRGLPSDLRDAIAEGVARAPEAAGLELASVRGHRLAFAFPLPGAGGTSVTGSVPGASPGPPAAPSAMPPAARPDADPPKLVISHPRDGMEVTAEELTLAGLVSDNVGVERVTITVNGEAVGDPRALTPGTGARSLPLTLRIALREGENVVVVNAFDRAGNATQSVSRVYRRAGAATAAAPPAPRPEPPKGDRWAVVIGIGSYDDPRIGKLRYTVPDAEAMYRYLTTDGGYAPDHVVLLTDKTERKPTLRNIRWALGEFLARRAVKQDTVFIYYAGHGAPEIDQQGIESDGVSKYLIPIDADPDTLYSTAFPMDEIRTIFGRIEAERVIVFLDACYSGATGGRTFARAGMRASNLNDQFLERLTRSKGRVIVTAAAANEVSLELPEFGHGIFTYYLLEGLRGKADANGDGIITLGEVYQYVEEQVVRKSRAAGGRQHPVMKGEMEGAFPLAVLSQRQPAAPPQP